MKQRNQGKPRKNDDGTVTVFGGGWCWARIDSTGRVLQTPQGASSHASWRQFIRRAKEKAARARWWDTLDARSITAFQLFETRLCMPFAAFQAAVEECLGRPIFTHEFTGDGLRSEYTSRFGSPN